MFWKANKVWEDWIAEGEEEAMVYQIMNAIMTANNLK